MKAICILGSPRPDGSTAAITAEIASALASRGIATTTYALHDAHIGMCCGCKSCDNTGECAQVDDMQKIIADIMGAQLLIVASPSYWGDVTAQLKRFIDRCTPYSNTCPMRRTPAAMPKGIAIAVRAGNGVQENLRLVHTIEHFLGHLDIPLLAQLTLEGINTKRDLDSRPNALADACALGLSVAHQLHEFFV